MEKFEENRIEKANKLKEKGTNPYGESYNHTVTLKSALDSYSEEKEGMNVRCAGRIMTMRPHGKAAFLHLKDWTGKIQIYIKQDKLKG